MSGIVNGKHSVTQLPATAGNVPFTYTVPEGAKQKFLYGHIKLTTNATVADRRVIVSLYDSADVLINDIHAGAVVAASQTNVHHDLMQGVYRETAFISNTLQVPVPIDWIALSGYKFVVSIENGQAGDSFSGAGCFESVQ